MSGACDKMDKKSGAFRVIGLVPAVRGFFARVRDDNVSAFAAQAAFFIMLSLVPFSVLLLSLLSFVQIDGGVYEQMTEGGFLPELLTSLIKNAIPTGGGLTVISAAAALWSSSRGILVIIRGLNSVCRVKETRNVIVLRLRCAAYTFILLLALLMSVGLMLFSLGTLPAVAVVTRYITVFSVLSCSFLLMYAYLPSHKEDIKTRVVGALAASAGWMAFTAVFSLYVSRADGYSRLYGSLAAVALAMLWLYSCMYIFFLGEELNEYING